MTAKEEHQNIVELMGHYGGDEAHALSAWTSTSRDLDVLDQKTGKTKRDRIPGILTMLASNGHETPFEKSSLHFLVTTDIATHIHIIKHRIGVSVNGESARYKELKDDKYYVPQDWPEAEVLLYTQHLEHSLDLYHGALRRLEAGGMDKKRAKESARFYLPYGNQIQADVMFNFRSFYHFLKLRYSTHAQAEVRDAARKMLQAVIDLPGAPFKITLQAFKLVDANGFIVPPFKD
ncbi:MAG: FAD-dependent thymidylate synthase [Candidatus Paceibacterota bacterium]|jgi:flavin-dependent thymidylate synthase